MVKIALVGTAFVAMGFIIVLASDDAFAKGGGGGSHSTSGYYRANGTYVQGYHATNPNSTKLDNYSTKGNINPWTGKAGTKSPYGNSSARHYYGATGVGAVSASPYPAEWGAPYSGGMQFAPASNGSTVLSPSAVNNPYHPQWTVQVVR